MVVELINTLGKSKNCHYIVEISPLTRASGDYYEHKKTQSPKLFQTLTKLLYLILDITHLVVPHSCFE